MRAADLDHSVRPESKIAYQSFPDWARLRWLGIVDGDPLVGGESPSAGDELASLDVDRAGVLTRRGESALARGPRGAGPGGEPTPAVIQALPPTAFAHHFGARFPRSDSPTPLLLSPRFVRCGAMRLTNEFARFFGDSTAKRENDLALELFELAVRVADTIKTHSID